MELSKLEQIAFNQLLKREKQYELRVKKALAQTLNTIRGDMAKIYEKYAKNGKLTRAEMARYNKYITMEKQLMKLVDPAIKANIETMKRLLPEQYNEAFFQYAWAMDNGNGVRLAYGIQNKNNIMELFSITNPKNIELANALHNYGPTAKKYIRNALMHNLALGKSYSSMISDIKTALNKTSSQAMRIIRTEGQRAISKGQDDLYLQAKAKGIEGKIIWDATLDGRTRPSHAKMDGVAKSDDGLFYGLSVPTPRPVWEGLPPEESINCRCRERFEVDGYSPQLRRTREQGIIPYQKYDDWKKTYGKNIEPAKKPKVVVGKVPVVKAKKPTAVQLPPTMQIIPPKPVHVPRIPQATIAPQAPAVSTAPIGTMDKVQSGVKGEAYYDSFANSNIVAAKLNGDRGINPSFIVDMRDPNTGNTFRGILKIQGTGDPVQMEYGTYLLDRALGINRVPNVVMKEIDGSLLPDPLSKGKKLTVTIQEFAPNSKTGVLVLDKTSVPLDEYRRISVLDYVTRNVDRHNSNWMYNSTEKRIVAIDNGRALFKDTTLVYSKPAAAYVDISGNTTIAAPIDIQEKINTFDYDLHKGQLKSIGIDPHIVDESMAHIKKLQLQGGIIDYTTSFLSI